MPVHVTPSGKPQDVPSMAEFNALAARVDLLETEVGDLDVRVDALETAEPEPPGDLSCTIVLGGVRTVFSESAAVDLGDYVDPAGRFVMSCKRLTLPGC